jgi:hypothetical protein
MRTLTFLKFYLLGVGGLFILYSFTGLTGLQKFLIFLVFTLFSPKLFRGILSLRGVRKGDVVLITMRRETPLGFYVQKLPARALGSGKIGDVIEVEYGGDISVGEITGYGGLFFPAEVNILYYEK